MTDQITVPRATWDALQQALKDISEESYDKGSVECANHALTAAASVSHANPETPPPPEGGAITSESALALLVKEMRYIATITNGQAHRIAMMTLEKVTAANAVSEPKGLFVDLIASHGPEFVAEIAAIEPQAQREIEEWLDANRMQKIGSLHHELVALFVVHLQATEPAANWATYPEKCPITRRDFFMVIEHPELGMAPTYGGPYDSYTIPHMGGKPDQQMHDRELMCHRFDHDLGYWVDDEIIPLRVIHDDFLPEDDSSKASEPVVKDSLTVPAGYKLVPVEPTDEMMVAWDTGITWEEGYRAMLAAAPEAKQ